MKKQKHFINPYLLVILSFVMIIIVGGVLLMMPFTRTDHQFGNFLDSIFLATSAACVTGLNSFAQGIGEEFNFGGQLIIMLLIQLGGLGFITFLTFFITLFAKKLQFKDRLFVSLMVNSEDVAEVVTFVRNIIIISFSFELLGFILGLPVFLPNCDTILQGLWYSLFHSVSAYNNAGFDLFGSASLIRDATPFMSRLSGWGYYYLCSYIMFLIVAGGISFLVVIDIFTRKKFKQLRVFTKVSLMMTAILLTLGFVVFFMSEGFKSPFNALFQSVTCRTAGFATVNQDDLSVIGKIFSCFLMFFGGNPLGTAGGVKTTTLYIIVLAMVCYVTGKKEVTSFHRKYSSSLIVKAMSLVLLAIVTIFVSYIAVYSFENKLDVTMIGLNSNKSACLIFEVFSAFGTVGVTTGVTPYLSIGSKIVLIMLMFIGRLGPFTFFQLLGSKMKFDEQGKYKYIEEDFLIG